MIKRKNKKIGSRRIMDASVLASTLLVLGIIVAIALGVSLVTLRERKASIGTGRTELAYQSSDAGVENVVSKLTDTSEADVTLQTIFSGSACNADGTIQSGTSKVQLFDSADVKIDCNNPGAKDIYDVKNVKSVGEASDSRQAVTAPNPCYESNLNNGLIGKWGFEDNNADGNFDDDTGSNNDAVNCSQHTNPVATTIWPVNSVPSSDPAWKNDGSGNRQNYVSFNEGAGRNCAKIADKNIYHREDGTVSFWVRFRGAVPQGNINKDLSNTAFVFSKDAFSCDRGASPHTNHIAIPPSSRFLCRYHSTEFPPHTPKYNNDDCDCGHLSFFANWYDLALPANSPPSLAGGNFSARFQNDGDDFWQSLSNDNNQSDLQFNNTNWSNKWHLATLTFSPEEYILYIDGKIQQRVDGSADLDGLEGLLNNDWDIYFGASYPGFTPNEPLPLPDLSSADFTNYMVWAKVDMDDLRIYDRPLYKCEVRRLFDET